jgi:hypothetical protein
VFTTYQLRNNARLGRWNSKGKGCSHNSIRHCTFIQVLLIKLLVLCTYRFGVPWSIELGHRGPLCFVEWLHFNNYLVYKKSFRLSRHVSNTCNSIVIFRAINNSRARGIRLFKLKRGIMGIQLAIIVQCVRKCTQQSNNTGISTFTFNNRTAFTSSPWICKEDFAMAATRNEVMNGGKWKCCEWHAKVSCNGKKGWIWWHFMITCAQLCKQNVQSISYCTDSSYRPKRLNHQCHDMHHNKKLTTSLTCCKISWSGIWDSGPQ